MINNTVESVLKGKYPGKTISFCAKLEMYKETPIFIPVNVTEEAVYSVARELSGSYPLGGTDLEAPQGWLLKFGEDSNKLCKDWLANGSPTQAAYCTFMPGYLIELDKKLYMWLIGVGEM